MEYRVSLERNLGLSVDRKLNSVVDDRETESSIEDKGEECESVLVGGEDDLGISPQVLRDLAPKALDYVQQLTSELANAEEVSVCN